MSREAFEQYAKYHGFNTRLRNDPESPDTYFAYETQVRYSVWQACESHMKAEYKELKREQEMYYASLLESHKQEVAKLHAVIARKDEAIDAMLKVAYSLPPVTDSEHIIRGRQVNEATQGLNEALALPPENTKLVEVGVVKYEFNALNTKDENGDIRKVPTPQLISSFRLGENTKLYAIVKDGE